MWKKTDKIKNPVQKVNAAAVSNSRLSPTLYYLVSDVRALANAMVEAGELKLNLELARRVAICIEYTQREIASTWEEYQKQIDEDSAEYDAEFIDEDTLGFEFGLISLRQEQMYAHNSESEYLEWLHSLEIRCFSAMETS